jgi:hypothetical protein
VSILAAISIVKSFLPEYITSAAAATLIPLPSHFSLLNHLSVCPSIPSNPFPISSFTAACNAALTNVGNNLPSPSLSLSFASGLHSLAWTARQCRVWQFALQ